MDWTPVKEWLTVLAPYAAILVPTLIGLSNRNRLGRVETNVDGHLSRMTDIVASKVDPVAAQKDARGLLQTAKVEAADLVETARGTATELIETATAAAHADGTARTRATDGSGP